MHHSIHMKDVVANPFRYMERYPVNEEKIQLLLESIDRTGFWDNLVARKVDDKYELAYGHHRWIAYKKRFGDDCNINLIVRNISDDDMLRIMADENMQEFGTNSSIEQETVRAVVQAYAEGRIQLPKVPKDTNIKHIRHAPSFRKEGSVSGTEHPYTAQSVANFLGWTQPNGEPNRRVLNALSALEGIEEGLVDEEDLQGLTSDQAETIATESTRIKKSYEKAAKGVKNPERRKRLEEKGTKKAKEVSKRVATKVKQEKDKPRGERYGVRDVRDEMEAERARLPKDKIIPSIEKFCEKLSVEIGTILNRKDKKWMKINELIRVRDQVSKGSVRSVVVALERLSRECLDICESLTGVSNDKPKSIMAKELT